MSGDDARTAALRSVDANLGDVIKLEQNAVYLVDHGNEAGARSEIKNSAKLLNKALPAADALTTPPELRQFAPPDTSWDRVGQNTRSAISWGKRALGESGGALAVYVGIPLKKKEDVYSLVHAEINHPMCAEVINVQSIAINGVPQGGSEISVDVACSRPVSKVIVVLPGMTAMKMIPDGQVTDAILSAADAMQLKMNAGHSGGVTVQTATPVAGTQKVETEIIPIAGDSHPPEVITRVS